MLSKFEIIGMGISVLFMALALYLVQVEDTFVSTEQSAQLSNSGAIVVEETDDVNEARTNALIEASDITGKIQKMVIDDIKVGEGEAVKKGDTVAVHYVGRLQNGTEFDNSKSRGSAFTFTIGEGKVIKGWEDGLLGMKEGGSRILVIPPDLAYGAQSIGPIPPNSTLVFAIELLEIR